MPGWIDILKRALAAFWTAATATLRLAGRLGAVAASIAGHGLRRVLEVVLALLLLFLEWGWRPLAALLGRLARYRPWALLEGWIAALPPYGALVVFGLPSALLLPLKILALWLIANGHALLAAGLFVVAKVAGTAFVARIFLLTRPALMRLGWFVRLYGWIVPWQEAIFAGIRSSWAWRYGRVLKTRVVHQSRRAWLRLEPALTASWQRLRPRLVLVSARIGALGRRLAARLKAFYASNSSRS